MPVHNTRSKNLGTHPGLVDAPNKKRTSKQVIADKKEADKAKQARAIAQEENARRIAKVELEMQKTDDEDENRRITRLSALTISPNAQSVRRTYASRNLLEPQHDETGYFIGVSRDNELSASEHTDSAMPVETLTEHDTEPEEILAKTKKGRSQKSAVRQTVNVKKQEIKNAQHAHGVKLRSPRHRSKPSPKVLGKSSPKVLGKSRIKMFE